MNNIKRWVNKYYPHIVLSSFFVISIAGTITIGQYTQEIRKAIGITISIEKCDPAKTQIICTTPKEVRDEQHRNH